MAPLGQRFLQDAIQTIYKICRAFQKTSKNSQRFPKKKKLTQLFKIIS